jgi:hypothetical protein
MAGYNGPAYARMCSYSDSDPVELLAYSLRMLSATTTDCELRNVRTDPYWREREKWDDRPCAPRWHYELHWHTYLGWRVYMLCTGCIASDPTYEREHATDCNHGADCGCNAPI